MKKLFVEIKKYIIRKRSDIIPFIIALVFFIAWRLFGDHFVGAMWTFIGTVIMILTLFFMVWAGFTVLKSLFIFAGQLSLTIYLAQIYCSIQQRSSESDRALRDLLVIAFLYLLVNFIRCLFKALNEYYKKIEDERWSPEKIFTVSIFLIFTGFFLWKIYLVAVPIISNFCVF